MIDSDFKIERPKRYYRQGLNLLTHPDTTREEEDTERNEQHDARSQAAGSIRSRLSRIFHNKGTTSATHANGGTQAPRRRGESYESPSSPETSDNEGPRTRPVTPMLDPSTNTNPLYGQDDRIDKNGGTNEGKKKTRHGDVSKHTFYIENSQQRLKLYARNEVCQIPSDAGWPIC